MSDNSTIKPNDAPRVSLEARPERQYIRAGGSHRHVDYVVRVAGMATPKQRAPLRLALVLDRSGSMSGAKLATAKRAARAVMERLTEADRLAVIAFDDRIETLQPAAAVTPALRETVGAALERLQARASTALHEGWLTGCQAIAPEGRPGEDVGLAHCFLLTDGLANVGLTDPEAIASEAAGVRENARVSTSTFGIGNDYDERLLEPLAVAGGGQFHHLRTADEIASTFVGELAELFTVAAAQVRLELAAATGVEAEVISDYWVSPAQNGRATVALGDLAVGAERHVVVRWAFPQGQEPARHVVQARVLWLQEGEDKTSAWQETAFCYAGQQACDAETRDPAVMHWVGLQHAQRAQRAAVEMSQSGNLPGAQERLRRTVDHLRTYAEADACLMQAMEDLGELRNAMANAPLPAAAAKEVRYQSHRSSRGQKDLRE